MPIPWLAVLQIVPWADVIKNAPKVVEGAKKLLERRGKKIPRPEVRIDDSGKSLPPELQSVSALQARVVAMELATTELQNQMLASSELINTLAEQNSQLIVRIEAIRVRVAWLTAATLVLGVIAVSQWLA